MLKTLFQKIANLTALKKSKLNKKSNFLASLTKFVKYNNAFTIGLIFIFIAVSGAFATSPEAREAIFASEDIARSIDNGYILSVNLDNFNFNLQINNITEDAEKYYITYSYRTIAIEDYFWQDVEVKEILDVSKQYLNEKKLDLGLYVAEQLGENIDYQLSYLKEVQSLEREKGLTQKVVTTQYAGLIGKFLEPKEKVFPGYQPVILETEDLSLQNVQVIPQEETASDQENKEAPIAIPSIDRESLQKMIEEIISQQSGQQGGTLQGGVITAEETPTPLPEMPETQEEIPTQTPETQEETPMPEQPENPVLEENFDASQQGEETGGEQTENGSAEGGSQSTEEQQSPETQPTDQSETQ